VKAYDLFDFVNQVKLEDDISKVHIIDVRAFLLLNDDKYDIIINEPAPPWMKESSHTFSKEFLELLRDHLNEDGLVSQWVFANQMILRNGDTIPFKIFYKTFNEVFPYNIGFISRSRFPKDSRIEGGEIVVETYASLSGEMIFIGSLNPISVEDLNEPNDKMKARLKRIGITKLEDYYIFNNEDMVGFVGENVPVDTDDNAKLEFILGRNMYYAESSDRIINEIITHKNSK